MLYHPILAIAEVLLPDASWLIVFDWAFKSLIPYESSPSKRVSAAFIIQVLIADAIAHPPLLSTNRPTAKHNPRRGKLKNDQTHRTISPFSLPMLNPFNIDEETHRGRAQFTIAEE
ncbi:unnamed protein product [Linum trigynum]|uniref:Uncharacterized protein n=1 Tax=Linum trigynum TaxID=586398 RepID=A0AAV2CSR6_9ROSI